jgi:hypothetical protein
MGYLPPDSGPTFVLQNSINNLTWPSGQTLLEVG